MDIQKIRILLGLSADRPLSPEEKRRRLRYIVYPAMCLLFAGSLWLIYSPSEKERAAEKEGIQYGYSHSRTAKDGRQQGGRL